MQNFDWSHLQSFVAVAEHGSLSAAARAIRSSQPTLSRHIALLEQAIGARLFERSKAGVSLTDKGNDLITHAIEMADAAAKLSILSEGGSGELAGTVRITASQIVATYLLPDILTQLHRAFPKIEIELIASDDTNNLLRREADIALRMYRPTQEDVISRHIGNLNLGAYAAKIYIDQKGHPDWSADLMQHDFIGYDRNTLIIDGLRVAGFEVSRDFFKFRCDDQVVCWEMVCAGFGIGFNQLAIGDKEKSVVRVSGPDPVGQLPMWLTAHPEVRQTPRIRKVYDHLGDALAEVLSRP